MEGIVTSDIFKFMSLRSPNNYNYEKDNINIIRDNRILDSYTPDESHSTYLDQPKFSQSEVAKFVFEKILVYYPNVNSRKDAMAYNILIVNAVKTKYGINERVDQGEKIPRPYIQEFVDLIKKHEVNFDKSNLIYGLNEIIKKRFRNYSGIKDYIEVKAINNLSLFCYDYYYLFDKLYALYVAKRKYAINLEYVIDGLRALHVILWLKVELDHIASSNKGCLYPLVSIFKKTQSKNSSADRDVERAGDPNRTDCAERIISPFTPVTPISINTGEDLARLFAASPFIHQIFVCLINYYVPFNDIRPIGIGDLLVTKQFLCGYEAGEIAHVENVLKGESKERSHRRLDRSEEITSKLTETNEETEKELQTTDRYEMKKEVDTTTQQDLNAELNASVSGKYGPVEYTVSGGVSYGSSTTESRRSAENYAKDIVDRSLTRIQKRVREERISKKIREIEEINKHGLNNVGGQKHISGIYRWLDKRYKAQVYNYGKRLMFEFVIPEPAAFMAAAFERNRKKLNKPNLPQPPAFPALNISQISNATVNRYAALYNIADFEPEPAATIIISASFAMSGLGNQSASAHEKLVNIPDGYEAVSARAAGAYGNIDKTNHGIYLSVGGVVRKDTETQHPQINAEFTQKTFSLNNIVGTLNLTLHAYRVVDFAISVSITCNLTAEAKRKWQIKTYTKIMDAYETLLKEYKSKLTEYEDKLEGYEVSKGVIIKGRNPRINQEIIKTELKKHCITMIAKQFDTDATDDVTFSSMGSRPENIVEEGVTVPIKVPAIDIYYAKLEGRIIQFLEQAFEWPQISYLLYPYFWGKLPQKWYDAQKYFIDPDDNDPHFEKFLQAGSARVLVAIRPAYEIAVMHYLCSGEPWNGGPVPGIYHPLYIPIHEELRNQQDDLNGAEPFGDSWDVVVPTSVVYLQESSELPQYDCNPPQPNKE